MIEVKLKNGETLIVRRPTPEDAEKMVSYLNKVGGESDFLLFGENEFRLSVEQEKKYIEEINKQLNSIMLIGIIKDEIISVSQLHSPQRKRIAHTSELAISVGECVWGEGIGSIILGELINYAKQTGIIKIINLTVHEENKRAINLYKKFGFMQIGLYEKYFFVNEKYYNAIMMNLYL